MSDDEWARAALRRVIGDAMARAAHVLGWLDEAQWGLW